MTEDEKEDWATALARWMIVGREEYVIESWADEGVVQEPWTVEERIASAADTLREETLPVKLPVRDVLKAARQALVDAQASIDALLEMPDE